MAYDQLAADWRHRDQLTWQLPSVLIAVSGALISAVYGVDNLPPDVKTFLLAAGSVFTALLTIALGQNLYYQTVGEVLMDKIADGSEVKVSCLPKRKGNEPTFLQLCGKVILKSGSTTMFLLGALLTGCLGSLIGHLDREIDFSWVFGIVILLIFITTLANWIVFKIHNQP
jgi:uncharacterized membrane protein YfcA